MSRCHREAADILMQSIAMRDCVSVESLIGKLRQARVRPHTVRALAPLLVWRLEQALSTPDAQGGSAVRQLCEQEFKDDVDWLLSKLALGLESQAGYGRRTRTRRRAAQLRRLASAAVALAFALVPIRSYAMTAQDPFAGLAPVTQDELASRRGGFSVDGVDVSFGAVVKTIVNGAVILETQLTATSQGLMATQSGPATTSVTPIPGSPQLNVQVVGPTSTTSVSLVPGQTTQGAFASGVIITGPGGTSAAVSTFDPSRIVNAVSSSASNQSISQQVELNVVLSNYNSLKSQVQFSQVGSNVVNNVQAALAVAMPH